MENKLLEDMETQPTKNRLIEDLNTAGVPDKKTLDLDTEPENLSFGDMVGGLKDFGSSVIRDVIGLPQTSQKTSLTRDILKGTIGSEGIAGAAQLPGRAIGTLINIRDIQKLDETRGQLAESNNQLIRMLRETLDDEQREKITQRISENTEIIDQLNTLARKREMSDELNLSQKEVLGTSLRAGTSLAPFAYSAGATALSPVFKAMKSKTLVDKGMREFMKSASTRALTTATQGALFGVSEGLIQDESIREIKRRGEVGALFGGAFSLTWSVTKGLLNADRLLGTDASKILEAKANPKAQEFATGKTFEQIQNRTDKAARSVEAKGRASLKAVKDKLPNADTIPDQQINEAVTGGITDPIKSTMKYRGVSDNIINTVSKDDVVSGGVLEPKEVKVLDGAIEYINKWPDKSSRGILNLKETLERFYQGRDGFEKSDAIVRSIQRRLVNVVTEQSGNTKLKPALLKAHEEINWLEDLKKFIIGSDPVQGESKLRAIARSVDDSELNAYKIRLIRQLEAKSGIRLLNDLKAYNDYLLVSKLKEPGLVNKPLQEIGFLARNIVSSPFVQSASKVLKKSQTQVVSEILKIGLFKFVQEFITKNK